MDIRYKLGECSGPARGVGGVVDHLKQKKKHAPSHMKPRKIWSF